MGMTLFEIKQQMNSISQTIEAKAAKLAEKAAGAEGTIEDLEKDQGDLKDLQARFDILKAEHDRVEAAQIASLEKQQAQRVQEDPETSKMKAVGEFYKDAFTGKVKKDYQGLGAIPQKDDDLGFGENLLPTNLSNELIMEPFETNSLRQVEPVSNITGLEEPILSFDISDEDLEDITDKDTAREIKMSAGVISYGRFKTKIKATVKDTVLHGTSVNLATEINNALRSGLAIKEKMRAFDTSPDDTHAHMSFYSAKNNIKKVYGANVILAIIAAYANLPDLFSENAKVVMRKSDYFEALQILMNDNATYWSKKPEDVIGIPVIFNDRAEIPVVGDFRYSKQNYDIGTIYDTDKDVDAGEYYFVVTMWGDHQIRLKSAFRLAIVGEAPDDGGVTLDSVAVTGTAQVGETLGITPTYSSGTPTAKLKVQWERLEGEDDEEWSNIKGATKQTYKPVEDDIGKMLRATVTASGAATGTAVSAATAAVIAAS